jgi:hypothetical protein
VTTTEPGVGDTLTIARFDDIEWTNPPVTEQLPDHLREIARKIKRKGLVAGECGFFASHVTYPAGHVADPHSHSHSELAIPAGETYGFTAGPDGVAFLLVRTAQATHTIA